MDRSLMLEDLAALVECESPSADTEATGRCAAVLTDLVQRRLGVDAERRDDETGGRPSLVWRFGAASPATAGGPQTKVLLVGHLDTVWPLGTLAEIPFAVDGDRITGPGCFDMKAGLVQGIHALMALPDLDGVTLLVTSDEETGSKHSRALIEAEARDAAVALVLEPSADGALKVGRKGVSMYTLHVRGRAAHAGLEPENGANALIEMSHQALALAAIARPELGTTVTPTVAAAGTTNNVVPDTATLTIDARASTPGEQDRVDAEIRALASAVEGTSLELEGGPNRPPLPEDMSRELFERALAIGAEVDGLGLVEGVTVGGGSDGNFTAGVGTPTLDGLGAVGAGAHARHEWADAAAMAPRARLVAGLVADLIGTR